MIRVWSPVAVLGLVAALLIGAGSAAAATRYDPRLRFKTISTPRFDIHFHQGGDALARRLAHLVEAAAAEVDEAIGPPAGRVQVILVDQHDLPNGWATPLPYNTIEINAAAPSAGMILGNTDDWLRLVFVHEYTHIAHLSRAGGWIGGLRRVFGRHPVLFPNLFQPVWGIEGIATWQESAATGQGRVPAGDFRHVIERAAGSSRFDPIDRANGGNVDWPSGMTPYLYGAYFHDFLADRYGAGSLRRLADETARRPPYFSSLAYRRVFGRSLGTLWRDFEDATRPDAEEREGGVVADRLTFHGFNVSGPRHGPDGRIYYAAASPHHFPALMEIRAAGEAPRPVAPRFLGHSIGIAGSQLVVDEIEMVRSVGLQSDLFLVDPRSGRRQRLTEEARASDPDVAPDGRIVCVVQMTDRRALAMLPGFSSTGRPEIVVSEPFTDFSLPRWSPDGRLIAAERRPVGGPSEIVLVDPASGVVRAVASLPGGRSASPAWTPDGAHVLFSAAVDAQPFGIYRVDVAHGVIAALEGTGASARSPDVAPDGRTLVFIGYTPDGYDLFAMPLTGATWRVLAERPAGAASASHVAPPSPSAPEIAPRDYSPLRTLLPRSWTPVIESDAGEIVAGAATGAVDALGRHAYAVQAAWSARGHADWEVAYGYDRWRPTLFAAVAGDTDPWREGTYQTRDVSAGMFLRVSRVRRTHATLAAFQRTDETASCETCVPPVASRQRRAAVRLGWAISNARAFGYSVSPEEGGRFSTTLELPRSVFGSDGDGVTLTVDVRRYRRIWPRHGVLAWRAAAGGSWGDPEARRILSASGHGPETPGIQFGRGAIGLLRGFAEDRVAGHRAAVANVDYRVPLLRVGRGIGTAPIFLRHVHGAVFLDAGHAWSQNPRLADLRLSAGAELSADTVVGFVLPVTITAGAAWRRDGVRGARDVVAFGRIGRAF